MATPKYTALATLTLTGTDTEVVFASIPATYRDLVVVVQGTTNTASNIKIKLNGDASNVSYVGMWGNGSSPTSGANTNAAYVGQLSTAQGIVIGQVFDYSLSNKHKSILGRGGTASDAVWAFASRWASTTVVNSLAVTTNNTASENFAIGTTFDLYGVK